METKQINSQEMVNNLEGKKVTGKKSTKKQTKETRELKKFKTVNPQIALKEIPELKDVLNCKDYKVTRIEIKIIPANSNKEITSVLKLSGTKSQGFIDSNLD